MDRILPADEHRPLFGVAASRRIEAEALADVPVDGRTQPLMQRAGLAVARLALAVSPHARRHWIVAGSGNNGGDGLEAALQLHLLGKAVEVCLVAEVARLPADAAASLQRATAAGVRIRLAAAADIPALGPQDIAIDAMLGLGGSRATSGVMAGLIAQLNGLPCPVLSVDVPSGLDADTGQPLGGLAVHADHTLALLSLKPGLFTGAGRDHAGMVWLDVLDTETTAIAPDAWLNGSASFTGAGPASTKRPGRQHAQHKGSFGDVIVVGGAPGMVGAAVLAARSAHAAGAGRVWVAALDAAAPRFDVMRPELMWRPGPDSFDDAALADATVVCGCGGGELVSGTLPRLLTLARHLVLDADALNAIARDTELQTLLQQRDARGLASVITPHPLEAARLLGRDTAAVQADRLAAAQELAARYRCVVVLKGSGSIIAAPGEIPRVNASGNAALATAGTGDVLAGWIGGSWSASTGSTSDRNAVGIAFHATCTAVWQHGAAAEASGLPVLRASDLIEQLAGLGQA